MINKYPTVKNKQGKVFLQNPVQKISISQVICKHCDKPDHVVKYGTKNGTQQYWCQNCERKFVDNGAPPGMRTPANQIGSAVSMFYDGLSLSAICRNMNQTFGYEPSDSTVYEWIVKFSEHAASQVKEFRANTSTTWIADETVLKIGGKNTWFWDVIDRDSRFLLASHISKARTVGDAQKLFMQAVHHSKQMPSKILTDKLAAYRGGIESVFGAYTKHMRSKGFIVSPNTNMIERFHGTLKARTKVMRGMKSPDTAKLITDGWLVHYNFFRPHESLGGITPAAMAGIASGFPYGNWTEMIESYEG